MLAGPPSPCRNAGAPHRVPPLRSLRRLFLLVLAVVSLIAVSCRRPGDFRRAPVVLALAGGEVFAAGATLFENAFARLAAGEETGSLAVRVEEVEPELRRRLEALGYLD